MFNLEVFNAITTKRETVREDLEFAKKDMDDAEIFQRGFIL
jgi:hypothetical protein